MKDALLGTWPVWLSVVLLIAGGAAVLVSGPRLAATCETIARRTGLGQAITGAVLLGAATSLSGLVASITAAAEGRPALAMSNAVGGIAAQTAFLAIADFFHRGSNLEHAAASSANNFMSVVLIALLTLVLMGTAAPDWTVWAIHPASVVLVCAYVYGMRLAVKTQKAPMWKPSRTDETKEDEDTDAAKNDDRSNRRVWTGFIVTALVLGVSGFVVARSGVSLTRETGLSDSLVGGLFTAGATSMAELVTAIAAVRRGAVTLAVGDIVGGNVFDVLFVAAADIAYRGGSLYHAAGRSDVFIIALSILMTSVLLMGLVRREKQGPGKIGFESVGILGLWAVGFVIVGLMRDAA